MRKGIVTVLMLFLCFFSFGKEKNGKTFLIIFHEQELKIHKSSALRLELSFLDRFDTKTYSGNSEAALLITVPFTDWTTCDMGQTLVIVSNDKVMRLDEVAFRIIDLEETNQNFQSLLSNNPDDKNGRKKGSTTVKLAL